MQAPRVAATRPAIAGLATLPLTSYGKRRIVSPRHPTEIRVAERGVDLFQGTLDMLVLKAVSWGPVHGYSVAKWLQDTTNDVLKVEEGSLYPALHRMEARDWIVADWG